MTRPPLARPAFDPDGNFLTVVTDEYAVRALNRGEAVLCEGHLVVVPQPIRELTPDEKRRIAQAKERAKQ